MLTTRRKQ